VLYYELKDGAWFCVRPSGTEPKIKIYYGVSEKTRKKAKRRLEIIENSVTGMIKKLLDLN
jgi:phosphoglucomutase